MPYAQNKSLIEYGDLQSMHHADNTPDVGDVVEDDSPPKMVVTDGPGNLYYIAWDKGDAPVPQECQGAWNHKGKASEAIVAAQRQLTTAERKAAADAEAIVAAKEVAAEKERITEEAIAIAKAAEKPVRKSTKK